MHGRRSPHDGACGCGAVTYRVSADPLIVHCCHCRECQRQTGTAFVLNALVEADHVHLTGATTDHELATPSGSGQIITRCALCGTALYSRYMIREGRVAFVRVGTLDAPERLPPDVHIFTASKQPWVLIGEDIPRFEGFYRFKDVWSDASMARWRILFADRIAET